MWQSGKPKRLMSCLRWVASLRKLRNADRCELVCTSVRRVRASLSCLLRGLPKADHARLESITQHTRPVNIDGPSSTGRASWYRPGVTIHLEVLLDSTPSALPLAKYTVAAITYFPAVCERCSAAESGEPIAAPSGSMWASPPRAESKKKVSTSRCVCVRLLRLLRLLWCENGLAGGTHILSRTSV